MASSISPGVQRYSRASSSDGCSCAPAGSSRSEMRSWLPGAAVQTVGDRSPADARFRGDDERRAGRGRVHPDIVDLQQQGRGLRGLSGGLAHPGLLPGVRWKRYPRQRARRQAGFRLAKGAMHDATGSGLAQLQIGLRPVGAALALFGVAGMFRVRQNVPEDVRQIAVLVHEDPGGLLQPAAAAAAFFRFSRSFRALCFGAPMAIAAIGSRLSPGRTVHQAALRVQAAHPGGKPQRRDPSDDRPVPLHRAWRCTERAARCRARSAPGPRSGSPAPGGRRPDDPRCGRPAPPSGCPARARRPPRSTRAAGARAGPGRVLQSWAFGVFVRDSCPTDGVHLTVSASGSPPVPRAKRSPASSPSRSGSHATHGQAGRSGANGARFPRWLPPAGRTRRRTILPHDPIAHFPVRSGRTGFIDDGQGDGLSPRSGGFRWKSVSAVRRHSSCSDDRNRRIPRKASWSNSPQ